MEVPLLHVDDKGHSLLLRLSKQRMQAIHQSFDAPCVIQRIEPGGKGRQLERYMSTGNRPVVTGIYERLCLPGLRLPGKCIDELRVALEICLTFRVAEGSLSKEVGAESKAGMMQPGKAREGVRDRCANDEALRHLGGNGADCPAGHAGKSPCSRCLQGGRKDRGKRPGLSKEVFPHVPRDFIIRGEHGQERQGGGTGPP